MSWTTIAHAMGGAGTGAGGAGAGGEPTGFGLIPIALMFAVFYFLLFRPQQKRNKEHKSMLAGLKRGDEVVTAGGIFGRVHEIADEYALLDVGGGARIKVLRSSISSLAKAQDKKADKKNESRENKKDAPPQDAGKAASEPGKDAGKAASGSGKDAGKAASEPEKDDVKQDVV